MVLWGFLEFLATVVALVLAVAAVRVVRQFEWGVLLRFGKLVGTRSPGFNLIIPLVDRLVRIDLRTVTMVVEPQEVITRELLAAEALANAAQIINASPPALQLRYLQTLTEISGEHNSTIIPIPLDILDGLPGIRGKRILSSVEE